MSLFLAICPPESIREKIFTTIQNKDIPEELWERKEELHITLLFLSKGNPDSEYLQSIKERLVRFPFSSFELQIGGLNLWSSKEYQILHLKIANSDELISIQSRIITLFPEIKKSIHEFSPHISLIRSSGISKQKAEELKNKFSNFSTESFLVDKIHLYKGEKDPKTKRNRYRILESFPSDESIRRIPQW